MTFDKDGSFKQSGGIKGPWKAESATQFKLWNYDPATLNEDYTQFSAVGAQARYFGRLHK